MRERDGGEQSENILFHVLNSFFPVCCVYYMYLLHRWVVGLCSKYCMYVVFCAVIK